MTFNCVDCVSVQAVQAKQRRRTQEENATESITERINQINIKEKLNQNHKKNLKRLKTTNTTKRTPKEKMPLNSLRFNGLKHGIDYDNPNEPRKAYRCKKEGCGLPTTVYCVTCKVHLCFVTGKSGRNCFKRFHDLCES